MIICDDGDTEKDEFLLPFKELQAKENLMFCYVYDGVALGKNIFRYADEMKDKTNCIVLCITERYCKNAILMCLSRSFANYNKQIICLLKDPNIAVHERLFFLSCTIIYKTSADWKVNLVRELKRIPTRYPSFSKPILPKNFSDVLHNHGFPITRLKWDMHGVMVQIDDQILKIDLAAFEEHLQEHEKYQTHQVCSDCSGLRSLNTTVAVVFDKEKKVSYNEAFNELFAKLASSVIDVVKGYHDKTIWTVLCTMKGEPLEDSNVASRLNNLVYYGLADKCIQYISGTYCYPEFESLHSRKESFIGHWSQDNLPPIDQLAEAGFFFSEYFDSPICFHCRTRISEWRKNDDPFFRHYQVCPHCPYVQPFITDELIADKTEEVKSIIINETVEDRILSFHKFDIHHLLNYDNIKDQDRETVIRQIAEAGFHYYGLADLVSCSFCGLKLSSYEADECLIHLHAKLSPKCKFVLKEKGGDFVETVLNTVRMEARNKNTEIQFHVRTLDKHPRRDLPRDLFRPAFVFET